MRTKKNVSVGIDGITCVVSGCLVPCETKFPEDSDKPLMKLTPKQNTTEIGVILPRAIRQNNNIGFRISDTKMLLDTVQTINRALKTIIRRDWSELLVKQIEVACTVDIGCADELIIDSLAQLFTTKQKEIILEKSKNPAELVFERNKEPLLKQKYSELGKAYMKLFNLRNVLKKIANTEKAYYFTKEQEE